jgi:hypothetical protein
MVDHYYAWGSDLTKFMIPQVYQFLEFVVWCDENYIPSKQTVISTSGFVLIEITPQSIFQNVEMAIESKQ